MNYKYDDRSFKGIEKMSFQLHCPARQLQRIMNEFEKQGVVKKTGKGAYKLIEMWISDQFPIGIALEIDIWEIRRKALVDAILIMLLRKSVYFMEYRKPKYPVMAKM